jgi:hypothetical protein
MCYVGLWKHIIYNWHATFPVDVKLISPHKGLLQYLCCKPQIRNPPPNRFDKQVQ